MKKTFRISLAAQVLIIAMFIGSSLPIRTEEANPLVRRTVYGDVEGIEAAGSFGDGTVQTWAWLGVPYAQPPVGELRWKAPRSPQKWTGVRKAKSFSDACTQYTGLMSTMNCADMGKLMGREDCLYLNVWRPRTSEKGLPVFFWIHGGANNVGQSAMTLYNGSTLAGTENIVVVSINYRLGPFGWFAHPALRSGDALDNSGNFGTLDILHALKWVHDNIEAFGGNPGNVTIAGESAGGENVYSMLVSPLAAGLFHRAISQSGAPFTNKLKDGEARAHTVLLDLVVNDKLASSESEAENFIRNKDNNWISDYLRKKRPEEIYGRYKKGPFGNLSGSNQIFVDGHVIPEKPTELLAKGKYNKTPFIAGNNREEAKLFLPMMLSDLDDAKLCGMIRDMNPENPEVTVRDYMKFYDKIIYNPLAKFSAASFKAMGVTGPARKMSKYQDEIFVYRFDWDEEAKPLDYVVGAAHGMDLAFMFGNFLSDSQSALRFAWNEKNKAGRINLSKRMMAYWANFARTGNPNGNGLPEWKAWPKKIIFDTPR